MRRTVKQRQGLITLFCAWGAICSTGSKEVSAIVGLRMVLESSQALAMDLEADGSMKIASILTGVPEARTETVLVKDPQKLESAIAMGGLNLMFSETIPFAVAMSAR